MPRPVLTIATPYTPEMLQAATRHIESLLSPDSEVFEFGSGYSTVWLAQRASYVNSVEHDAQWKEETARAIDKEGLRANVWLVPEEELGPSIDLFGDFDLVLVDCLDRQRVTAVQHAIAHVKPGGYLVLDDSQWPMLAPARRLLDGLGWQARSFIGEHKRKNGHVRHHETTVYSNPLSAGDEEE